LRPAQAPARSSRLAGAAGALALQGGFLLMFLASMPALRPPPEIGRELSLLLPGLRPVSSPARPPQDMQGPVTVTPPLFLSPPNMPYNALTQPLQSALPGIGTFGQALNNCAPEKYSSLPPDQQARCPRPGAGVAIQDLPNPLGPLRTAKDEAYWQEQWDEAHWMPGPCGPGQGSVVGCLMQQSIAEYERAEDVRWYLARDKAARLKPPPPKIPDGARASAPQAAKPPG
jgi:hypothetical protein